ncbi:hypothetical protein JHL21_03225 [Devosia sp. WQ 349]|uniref:hypothetical protein n=1 Tax=Devosia sp. WQ 349K1 TaxID=2800329 RepID=UPI001908939C|nr:hypothetical protein [Devosia sp. WQ 349K1]MBK1793507.1 hypothetical protein [Devosia sp. WQ 349K1]
MSFDVISCQLLHASPHRAIAGRVTGKVRVRIRESFMGNDTEYGLDLPVKADCANASSEIVRTALLGHAARQLNKLKSRHQSNQRMAAE